MSSNRFHLVEDPPGNFELWGNQAEGPCLRLGRMPFEQAEEIWWSVECAWERNDEWREGLIHPVPVPFADLRFSRVEQVRELADLCSAASQQLRQSR